MDTEHDDEDRHSPTAKIMMAHLDRRVRPLAARLRAHGQTFTGEAEPRDLPLTEPETELLTALTEQSLLDHDGQTRQALAKPVPTPIQQGAALVAVANTASAALAAEPEAATIQLPPLPRDQVEEITMALWDKFRAEMKATQAPSPKKVLDDTVAAGGRSLAKMDLDQLAKGYRPSSDAPTWDLLDAVTLLLKGFVLTSDLTHIGTALATLDELASRFPRDTMNPLPGTTDIQDSESEGV